MDQEPLVIEETEAGKKFLDEFDKSVPVLAAFWLKEGEDSGWYLYVASDQITDRNIKVAYAEVGKVFKTIHDPNLDVLRVMLIGARHPFARAALEVYRRYPDSRVPIRLRVHQFGGQSVEGVYLYPPRVGAMSK